MNDYCLFACSTKFADSNGAEFIQISQELGQQIGVTLTNVDFAFLDEKFDFSSIAGPMTGDDFRRLNQILREEKFADICLRSDQNKPDEIENFGLYSELANWSKDEYQYACIHFPLKLVENWPSEKLFSLTSDLLTSLNKLGTLEYALITTMESSLPQTYFFGAFTESLSETEILDLVMWHRQNGDRKIKVRGLYWGNLLSSEHMAKMANTNEFIENLDKTGCRHTSINGDDLFFMFPTPNLATQAGGTIHTLLTKSGLLMQPSDEDIETANQMKRLHRKDSTRTDVVIHKAPDHQVEYYRTHPPSSICDFLSQPISLEGTQFDGHGASGQYPDGLVETPNIVFKIGCPCGGNSFQLIGEGTSEWLGYNGDYLIAERFYLKCTACNTQRLFFDPSLHGYNAEISRMEDGAFFSEEEVESNKESLAIEQLVHHCPNCNHDVFEIFSRFEQHTDRFEEPEFAGREENFFSCFTAIGKCSQCSNMKELIDYECA